MNWQLVNVVWWCQRVKLIYSRHVFFVEWTTRYHIDHSKHNTFRSTVTVQCSLSLTVFTFAVRSTIILFILLLFSLNDSFLTLIRHQSKKANKLVSIRFSSAFCNECAICNMLAPMCVFRIQYSGIYCIALLAVTFIIIIIFKANRRMRKKNTFFFIALTDELWIDKTQ